MKLLRLIICLTLVFMFTVSSGTVAQELKTIQLPPPQKNIGIPLMQALNLRQSIREYSTKKLPLQELSNLLWAAWGINRPERDLRTAPSASNRQELDVYAVMEEGVYLYDAQAHALEPVLAGDIRSSTGTQEFVGTAPLNLVYIADFTRMKGRSREAAITTASADTGFISQNVYLYCASQGLGTVVRGLVDRDKLSEVMKLGPDKYITYGQTVGYPK